MAFLPHLESVVTQVEGSSPRFFGPPRERCATLLVGQAGQILHRQGEGLRRLHALQRLAVPRLEGGAQDVVPSDDLPQAVRQRVDVQPPAQPQRAG